MTRHGRGSVSALAARQGAAEVLRDHAGRLRLSSWPSAHADAAGLPRKSEARNCRRPWLPLLPTYV